MSKKDFIIETEENIISLKIDEKNGSVKISFRKDNITFEAIEEIYNIIKPLLGKRREAGIIEGASK